MNLSVRLGFFLGFIFCLGLLLIAAYFQLIEDLEPCPLCITQRVAILVVGIVFLAGALHNSGLIGTRIYAILGLIFSVLGAAVSVRHVWIQNLPPSEVPTCGPGLEYVFNHFPLSKTIELLFTGSGECADTLWTFFGMSIPAWTLVAFVLLSLLSGLQFKNARS